MSETSVSAYYYFHCFSPRFQESEEEMENYNARVPFNVTTGFRLAIRILYGCEAWSFRVTELHSLRVFGIGG
jgi:hypothetical protein